jgi:hypothetical protein
MPLATITSSSTKRSRIELKSIEAGAAARMRDYTCPAVTDSPSSASAAAPEREYRWVKANESM